MHRAAAPGALPSSVSVAPLRAIRRAGQREPLRGTGRRGSLVRGLQSMPERCRRSSGRWPVAPLRVGFHAALRKGELASQALSLERLDVLGRHLKNGRVGTCEALWDEGRLQDLGLACLAIVPLELALDGKRDPAIPS